MERFGKHKLHYSMCVVCSKNVWQNQRTHCNFLAPPLSSPGTFILLPYIFFPSCLSPPQLCWPFPQSHLFHRWWHVLGLNCMKYLVLMCSWIWSVVATFYPSWQPGHVDVITQELLWKEHVYPFLSPTRVFLLAFGAPPKARGRGRSDFDRTHWLLSVEMTYRIGWVGVEKDIESSPTQNFPQW
jgi:hypothetical protein